MAWLSDFDVVSRVYDALPIPTHADALHGRIDVEGPAVDLGGGTGRFTQRLHGEGTRSIVLDASPGMLTRARARGLQAVHGAGQALPFQEGTLAAVTITEAFHHFTPHHDEVLDEIRRTLRDDGVLLIEEIDPTRWLGRAIEAGEHVIGFDSVFFTPDELEDMVRTRFGEVARGATGSFTYLVEARDPRSRGKG